MKNPFKKHKVIYLSGGKLKEMFLKSYQKIEKEKEEINKINVFPVPDQDTGTNLSATLKGIQEKIKEKDFKDLSSISEAILEGALESAQGNVGVIYVGFLSGFLPALKDKNPIGIKKIAEGFKEGAEKARLSISDPKEGTILDVIEAASSAFQEKEKKGEEDLFSALEYAVEKARFALFETQKKLDVLKKAKVVDAGGLGFLMILESWLEGLGGKGKKVKRDSEKMKKFIQIISNRYEVMALIKEPKLSEEEVKKILSQMGNSLDIVKVKNRMKIHIHTDFPEGVKKEIKEIGKIEKIRVEDMAKEISGEKSTEESIGIAVDESCPINEKTRERYQIEVVPLRYSWPPEEELPGENIFQKMREAEKRGIKELPKTAGGVPGKFKLAYEKLLKKFEKVLALTLTPKVSAVFSSAQTAREMLSPKEKERVFLLGTLQAGPSLALILLKALEMIREGEKLSKILKALKDYDQKVHLYLLLEDPKWLENIGRIDKKKGNLIRRMKKIRLHPLLTLKDGMIEKGGIVFAKDEAEALFKKIKKESRKIRKEGKRIRVVITHCDNLEKAEKLKELLKEIDAEIPYICLASPIVGAATGPGTLFAGWGPIE